MSVIILLVTLSCCSVLLTALAMADAGLSHQDNRALRAANLQRYFTHYYHYIVPDLSRAGGTITLRQFIPLLNDEIYNGEVYYRRGRDGGLTCTLAGQFQSVENLLRLHSHFMAVQGNLRRFNFYNQYAAHHIRSFHSFLPTPVSLLVDMTERIDINIDSQEDDDEDEMYRRLVTRIVGDFNHRNTLARIRFEREDDYRIGEHDLNNAMRELDSAYQRYETEFARLSVEESALRKERSWLQLRREASMPNFTADILQGARRIGHLR